jgi:PmbA protein
MQDIEGFSAQLIAKAKKLGASDAEILVGVSDDLSVSVRKGGLEEVERAENSGFGLRVFVGKKSAIISSSKFEDADELAKIAVKMAQEAPADEFSELAPKELLAQKIIALDLLDGSEPSPEDLQEIALKTEDEALKNAGVTNSEGANSSYSHSRFILATSNGFSQGFATSSYGISVSIIAGKGHDMQTDYEYSAARHLSDLDEPALIGKSAAERAVAKLNPRKVKSGSFPVIYDRRVSKRLVSDLASGANGASIARGTSYLKNKLGEQVFDSKINIIDNPHIVRGLASKPFDGEGVANEKREIIKDGVLQTWFLDIRSANQLGLKTTGHAARGAGSPPSPSSTNLYMENGSVSAADLISSIKQGLYVNETFGMGINYTNGDYSMGVGGFWIENGEITYPVSEVTLAGNLLEMFMQITPANDLEFKYGTNAPTLLIEKMTLAGS